MKLSFLFTEPAIFEGWRELLWKRDNPKRVMAKNAIEEAIKIIMRKLWEGQYSDQVTNKVLARLEVYSQSEALISQIMDAENPEQEALIALTKRATSFVR
jgi:hypothetical protein